MNLTRVICALLLVGKHYRSQNHTLYFTEVQKSLISLLVKGMNSWLIESFTFHISRLCLKGSIWILSSLSHLSRQVSMIADYQETCRHTWIQIWKKKDKPSTEMAEYQRLCFKLELLLDYLKCKWDEQISASLRMLAAGLLKCHHFLPNIRYNLSSLWDCINSIIISSYEQMKEMRFLPSILFSAFYLEVKFNE